MTLLPAMQTAYLSLGSNLGDRLANLEAGLAGLEKAGMRCGRSSSLYQTEPVGFLDQPWFVNIAVSVATCLPPGEMLRRCLEIERARGRTRSRRNGPRTLDIDILLVGSLVMEEPGLIIPHPRMAQRRFVLEPLAEIAPEVYHPVLRKTIRSLLDSCPDPSSVHLYTPGKDA